MNTETQTFSDTGVVLVSGATGNVGREVVSQLTRKGVTVRALARTPNGADLPDGVEVVYGDLSAPEILDKSLEGVEAVFLVWPGLPTDFAPAVLDALKKHARRVVYLSSMSVREDRASQADPITAFHAAIEQQIEQSGLEWTFLRVSGLATNTLGWAGQIRTDGVVRWPCAAAARSLIHEKDIASVATQALGSSKQGFFRTSRASIAFHSHLTILLREKWLSSMSIGSFFTSRFAAFRMVAMEWHGSGSGSLTNNSLANRQDFSQVRDKAHPAVEGRNTHDRPDHPG
jgi:NAD(P)-dependent dehydrogenase (short-subunit alcohol dehydrogenase family)